MLEKRSCRPIPSVIVQSVRDRPLVHHQRPIALGLILTKYIQASIASPDFEVAIRGHATGRCSQRSRSGGYRGELCGASQRRFGLGSSPPGPVWHASRSLQRVSADDVYCHNIPDPRRPSVGRSLLTTRSNGIAAGPCAVFLRSTGFIAWADSRCRRFTAKLRRSRLHTTTLLVSATVSCPF